MDEGGSSGIIHSIDDTFEVSGIVFAIDLDNVFLTSLNYMMNI